MSGKQPLSAAVLWNYYHKAEGFWRESSATFTHIQLTTGLLEQLRMETQITNVSSCSIHFKTPYEFTSLTLVPPVTQTISGEHAALKCILTLSWLTNAMGINVIWDVSSGLFAIIWNNWAGKSNTNIAIIYWFDPQILMNYDSSPGFRIHTIIRINQNSREKKIQMTKCHHIST